LLHQKLDFHFIFCFNDVNMLKGIQLSNRPDIIYIYGPKLNSSKLKSSFSKLDP